MHALKRNVCIITVFEQEALSVDVHSLVKRELEWLSKVTTSSSPGFQTLLAGHLNLTRALFTCEGVNKKDLGAAIVGCGHYVECSRYDHDRTLSLTLKIFVAMLK